MQFRLRTLVIALAIVPPVLAIIWWFADVAIFGMSDKEKRAVLWWIDPIVIGVICIFLASIANTIAAIRQR